MSDKSSSRNPYAAPSQDGPTRSKNGVDSFFGEDSCRRLRSTSRAVYFLSVVSGLIVIFLGLQLGFALRFWLLMEGKPTAQFQLFCNVVTTPVWMFLTYTLFKYARATSQVSRKENAFIREMLIHQKRCWIIIALLAVQMVATDIVSRAVRPNVQLPEYNDYDRLGRER